MDVAAIVPERDDYVHKTGKFYVTCDDGHIEKVGQERVLLGKICEKPVSVMPNVCGHKEQTLVFSGQVLRNERYDICTSIAGNLLIKNLPVGNLLGLNFREFMPSYLRISKPSLHCGGIHFNLRKQLLALAKRP